MNNPLANFVFETDEGSTRAVRVVMIDGEPWFVAKDVAEALDYTWNGSARIDHVPDEWRGGHIRCDPIGPAEHGCSV